MERSSRGTTLLELLTTLTITAVMIGIAVPVTGTFITANRIASQINALRGDIALTRSEAIRSKQDVVLCKSQDLQTCSRSGEWGQGWIVFIDEDKNRKRRQQERLISVKEALPGNMTLKYRAFGSRHYLAYHATGMTKTNGTFTFCDSSNTSRARALIVTKSGRARLSKTRSDGSPINCQ